MCSITIYLKGGTDNHFENSVAFGDCVCAGAAAPITIELKLHKHQEMSVHILDSQHLKSMNMVKI